MLTFLVILAIIKMCRDQWVEDHQEPIDEDFDKHWHENTPL